MNGVPGGTIKNLQDMMAAMDESEEEEVQLPVIKKPENLKE
jgi:hypothetical protein